MEGVSAKRETNTTAAAFLLRLTCGVFIGIACVMPGVSGGVLAAGLGLYLPMLDALAHLCSETRKSLGLLLPLGSGIAAGVLLGAVLLVQVLSRWYTPCILLFLGLVLGGVPSLVREANRGGFQGSYAAALLLGAAAASVLLLLRTDTAQAESLRWWQALLTGGIVAFGTVIPGISLTCILLLLGWYTPFLEALAGSEPLTLVYTAVGAVLTAIPLVLAVRRIYARHFGVASYTVLGFLMVTVGLSFPVQAFDAAELTAWLLLPVGFLLTILLSRASDGRIDRAA